jgi:hypothetical protein
MIFQKELITIACAQTIKPKWTSTPESLPDLLGEIPLETQNEIKIC